MSVWVADLAAGAATGRHIHPTPRFVYVLEGAVVLELDGKPSQMFKAGQAFAESRPQFQECERDRARQSAGLPIRRERSATPDHSSLKTQRRGAGCHWVRQSSPPTERYHREGHAQSSGQRSRPMRSPRCGGPSLRLDVATSVCKTLTRTVLHGNGWSRVLLRRRGHPQMARSRSGDPRLRFAVTPL
jgi:hypothetical protein